MFPKLLPKSALIRTSDVEPPRFNVLGLLQRLRFRLVVSLLPPQKTGTILEIGYGSGIFLPELARRCDTLYGLDIHPHAASVCRNLMARGVEARLLRGSASSLPFADRSVDCVVAVSCLEYMDDVDVVASEVQRVLRPNGCFVFATPGDSRFLDFGVKLLTLRNTREHYGERRASLIPTLSRTFVVEEEGAVPPIGGQAVTFYRGMRLCKPT